MAAFRWSKAKAKAAVLVAEDTLSNERIAEQAGVTRQGLDAWKRHPDFAARVAEHVAAYREAVLAQGIADRVERIQALDERWRLLKQVRMERAAAMQGEAPGAGTGLLVRQIKSIGVGKNSQVIEEYAVDTGLLREEREHEKQAAQELGQWTEKRELLGKDGAPLTFTIAIDRTSDDRDAEA